MHTIPDIAFAQPQKSYRIWLLICSHARTAVAAKSVTERSCALPISEVESHISERWEGVGEMRGGLIRTIDLLRSLVVIIKHYTI